MARECTCSNKYCKKKFSVPDGEPCPSLCFDCYYGVKSEPEQN